MEGVLAGELRLEEDIQCLEGEPAERIRRRTLHKFFPLVGTEESDHEYRFRVTVEQELPGTLFNSSSPSIRASVHYTLRVPSPCSRGDKH